jgi:DNA-binding XRE family transcriptional regulator
MANKAIHPMERLAHDLKKRFPDASLSLDRPRRASAQWLLDIAHEGHSAIVQWQAEKGFGISAAPDHGYGEGPDEVYMLEEAAYGRLVSLLLSKNFTAPPQAVSLRELRKERGWSQAELAAILDKQQGEISKIERRKDLHVSTLADYAQSMNGVLEMIVRFEDGTVRRVELEDGEEDTPRSASGRGR